MQYIMSAVLVNVILLSLAISLPVVMLVAVQAVSMVYSLCVPSVLCLTMILLSLSVVLK